MIDVADLLRDLIRFDTTNPPGAEAECIAYVQRLLTEAGAESRMYAKEDSRPNLVARLQGAGEAPPLLLYGHVDVVTTAGQTWTHPPFAADQVDGWIWGRGALDMKGGVAMLVDAFLRAARDELRPRGDLILLVLSDEEGGGDYGAKFVVEEHADLLAGVRHALGEFGAARVSFGGRRFYPIQVAEKQICWLRGVVRGPGGHGALGVKGSAAAKLGRILQKLDRGRLPLHVTPVARVWIETTAAALPRSQAVVLRSLLNPWTAELTLRAPNPQLQTLDRVLRNTVTPTIIRGGDKINVVPAQVEVELDGRVLPGFGPEDVIREVNALAGDELELEVVRYDPMPAHSDLSVLPLLSDVLRELDPTGIPTPMLQAGVTDGRFFARLGIQTYGFLPLDLPDDFQFLRSIHAADERVPADSVRFGARAVGRAVERYAG